MKRNLTTKQKLYALKTNKGTFVSTRQISDNEVSIYENEKVYRSDIYDDEKELVEMKEQIEKGDEYWVYHFPKDILPLRVHPFYIESEKESEFEIVDCIYASRKMVGIQVVLQVKWSNELMKEMKLTSPYVEIPITKYGTIVSDSSLPIKDDGTITNHMLNQEEAKTIEKYILRNTKTLGELNIYRPKAHYDYYEKKGDMWVHVYEIQQGRVYFNISDKDWTNQDVTIEEFMDIYDTKNPLTNNE